MYMYLLYTCIGLVVIVADIEWIFNKVDVKCLSFKTSGNMFVVVSEVVGIVVQNTVSKYVWLVAAPCSGRLEIFLCDLSVD